MQNKIQPLSVNVKKHIFLSEKKNIPSNCSSGQVEANFENPAEQI